MSINAKNHLYDYFLNGPFELKLNNSIVNENSFEIEMRSQN